MAITNGNSDIVMPVSPMGGFGNMGGFGGGDWGSLIVLFLICACFGGGFGFGGFGGGGADGAFPWLLAANQNTGSLVTSGFDHAATQAQLGDIQSAITGGFASAEVAGCNRAMDAMQTAYNNQIATMNQTFANQQALNAQLIADNTAQTQYIVNRVAPYPIPAYTVANPNTVVVAAS